MESLLCDEVWVSSPNCCSHEYKNGVRESSFYARMEDCEEGFLLTLQKEHTYMPRPGYLHYLYSQDLVKARFRAIRWLVKSGRRLNLSFGTIFCAANYLDRFISTNHCREWKYWMFILYSH
ncbi:putative cyclin-D7-1 [Carica papaya]|uniref:putative cyclin-D7-1 n=1 Tax=Carica papaya TaxID=3649 RepID=UPI000B8D03BF|nr:putative cyclin-D7-1 [Carica papaya]